ncbi:sulfatase [candidate division CSSED10-310 bacterium]|uniref:Sulfatase n=1 Tax=candidate division CSSED10-310 bacterium TaxID=2855610 RepID=A0ABV6Z1P7_UNCC1
MKMLLKILLSIVSIALLLLGYIVFNVLRSEEKSRTLSGENFFQMLTEATFLPKDLIVDLTKQNIKSDRSLWHIPNPRNFILEEGWLEQSNLGVRAIGLKSRLKFSISVPTDYILYFECLYQAEKGKKKVQTMTLNVNNHAFDKIHLHEGWNNLHMVLPRQTLLQGENTLTFSYDYPIIFPPEQNDSESSLLRFRKLGFMRKPRDTELTDTVLFTMVKASEGDAFRAKSDQTKNAIIFDRSGSLVLPVYIPAHYKYLNFTVSGLSALPDWFQFQVMVDNLEGESNTIFNCSKNESGQNPVSKFETVSLALAPYGDQKIILTFDLDTLSSPSVMIIDPQLSLFATRSESLAYYFKRYFSRVVDHRDIGAGNVFRNHRGPDKSLKKEPHPDIVMVILDAARPDHFGCYGYPKATTPFIDHLSRESVVYATVTALAPYTLCSVPTMISGLSFVHHGVLQVEHKLHQKVKTLAEYLRESGYSTISYSATPNNSIDRGFAQGFDEFHEMWKTKNDLGHSMDSHFLSHSVSKRFQELDRENPLYLQLHYVPPHEPYNPPSIFDVFGDPDYAGSYTGTYQTLYAINDRKLHPQPADFEEIISLYDGNLLRADHAFGIIYRLLQQRERWNNTVLLLTSDHGEAFFEHSCMGHNKTVYQEMLRVPFILKLPGRAKIESIMNQFQASLADIVPTFLELVGRNPEPEVEGMNLLPHNIDLNLARQRWLCARSLNADDPFFSCSTRRWKVIVQGTRYLELYDLDHDPREIKNILHLKPHIFSGLLDLVHDQIFLQKPAFASDRLEKLSSEDEAMLRELGYLED